MGKIHNLQILIAQQPQFSRIESTQRNGLANGAQIINVVNARQRDIEETTVKQMTKSEKTEKENSRRRRKTTLQQKIDLMA